MLEWNKNKKNGRLSKYDKNTFGLEPMTLILKLDLDMVKMYLYTENEVLSLSSSKFTT